MKTACGTVEFTKEELRALQLKGLEMLLYFKDFCDRHGLLFYFCGGCCIGALREKGFVPWDDDVDVFMPREDYEKLGRLWETEADTSRYSYCRSGKQVNYRNLFATVNDNTTTYIKPHQADLDVCHGLMMDILPLDGCPSGGFARKMQMFWALLYSIYNAQLVPYNHGKAVTLLGKLMLAAVPFKSWRYRIWQFAERKMTKHRIQDCEFITELCSGPGYMKNRYPREAFDEAVYKEFEGYQMPVPKGYDAYLKIAFGEYMQRPPKEKQVVHHDVVFCDLQNSYRQYKGKYYCVEQGEGKHA